MIISDIFKGDLDISSNTVIQGIVNGDVTVAEGAVLIVRGIVNGNIHFLKSSEGELHGMINGDVINNGGDIKIFGTIDGKVLENSGTTFVENEAVIRKKI